MSVGSSVLLLALLLLSACGDESLEGAPGGANSDVSAELGSPESGGDRLCGATVSRERMPRALGESAAPTLASLLSLNVPNPSVGDGFVADSVVAGPRVVVFHLHREADGARATLCATHIDNAVEGPAVVMLGPEGGRVRLYATRDDAPLLEEVARGVRPALDSLEWLDESATRPEPPPGERSEREEERYIELDLEKGAWFLLGSETRHWVNVGAGQVSDVAATVTWWGLLAFVVVAFVRGYRGLGESAPRRALSWTALAAVSGWALLLYGVAALVGVPASPGASPGGLLPGADTFVTTLQTASTALGVGPNAWTSLVGIGSAALVAVVAGMWFGRATGLVAGILFPLAPGGVGLALGGDVYVGVAASVLLAAGATELGLRQGSRHLCWAAGGGWAIAIQSSAGASFVLAPLVLWLLLDRRCREGEFPAAARIALAIPPLVSLAILGAWASSGPPPVFPPANEILRNVPPLARTLFVEPVFDNPALVGLALVGFALWRPAWSVPPVLLVALGLPALVALLGVSRVPAVERTVDSYALVGWAFASVAAAVPVARLLSLRRRVGGRESAPGSAAVSDRALPAPSGGDTECG